MANPTQKIHGGKHRNIVPQKGDYSNLSKDMQKEEPSKILLLTDSDALEFDGI